MLMGPEVHSDCRVGVGVGLRGRGEAGKWWTGWQEKCGDRSGWRGGDGLVTYLGRGPFEKSGYARKRGRHRDKLEAGVGFREGF